MQVTRVTPGPSAARCPSLCLADRGGYYHKRADARGPRDETAGEATYRCSWVGGTHRDAAFRGLTDRTAIDSLFDSLLRFIRSCQQRMQMLNKKILQSRDPETKA